MCTRTGLVVDKRLHGFDTGWGAERGVLGTPRSAVIMAAPRTSEKPSIGPFMVRGLDELELATLSVHVERDLSGGTWRMGGLQGQLSPLRVITLSSRNRLNARVPTHATHYAYAYPADPTMDSTTGLLLPSRLISGVSTLPGESPGYGNHWPTSPTQLLPMGGYVYFGPSVDERSQQDEQSVVGSSTMAPDNGTPGEGAPTEKLQADAEVLQEGSLVVQVQPSSTAHWRPAQTAQPYARLLPRRMATERSDERSERFDECSDLKVCAVTAPFTPTKFQQLRGGLQFAEPLSVSHQGQHSQLWKDTLEGRLHDVANHSGLRHLADLGARHYAWLCPGEQPIRHHGLWKNGAFVVFFDNSEDDGISAGS